MVQNGIDSEPFFLLYSGMYYYVYILYSPSLDRYYVGYTHDPEERLKKHNSGATKSTRRGIPWELVYTARYEDKSECIKREHRIKKMKSRGYIERLLAGSSGG